MRYSRFKSLKYSYTICLKIRLSNHCFFIHIKLKNQKAMHIPSILLLALIEFAFSLPINLHAFPKVDCRLAHCAEGVDCCTLPHDPGADPELTIITGPFSGNPVPLPGLGGDPGAPFDKRDNALEVSKGTIWSCGEIIALVLTSICRSV